MEKDGEIFSRSLLQGVGWTLGAAPIWIVLYLLFTEHQNRQAEAMISGIAKSMQSMVPVQQPRALKTRTENVAPRDVEDCLQETGGIANEQYQKCRTGYTIKVQE